MIPIEAYVHDARMFVRCVNCGAFRVLVGTPGREPGDPFDVAYPDGWQVQRRGHRFAATCDQCSEPKEGTDNA